MQSPEFFFCTFTSIAKYVHSCLNYFENAISVYSKLLVPTIVTELTKYKFMPKQQ